jgi:8-oxo-dGTP pyrophosphatase MutT (NUDIX family)
MKRAPLLALLRAHATTGLEPAERQMVEEMIAFVTREPACFERSCLAGHVTGSAWVVDPAASAVVLLFHAKLERWLQPGGHADGDADVTRVARREALEETGLATLTLAQAAIFDVDVHPIPARPGEPAHWHHDVRFLFHADRAEMPVASHESRRAQWTRLEDIAALTTQPSIARMARKTLAFRPPTATSRAPGFSASGPSS